MYIGCGVGSGVKSRGYSIGNVHRNLRICLLGACARARKREKERERERRETECGCVGVGVWVNGCVFCL